MEGAREGRSAELSGWRGSKLMFEQDVVGGRASSLAASVRRGGEREGKGANLNVSLSSLVSGGQAEPGRRNERSKMVGSVSIRTPRSGVECGPLARVIDDSAR